MCCVNPTKKGNNSVTDSNNTDRYGSYFNMIILLCISNCSTKDGLHDFNSVNSRQIFTTTLWDTMLKITWFINVNTYIKGVFYLVHQADDRSILSTILYFSILNIANKMLQSNKKCNRWIFCIFIVKYCDCHTMLSVSSYSAA